MIEMFAMEAGRPAAELYTTYQEYRQAVQGCAVSDKFKETFLHLLNEAYDAALNETVEASRAAKSPRPA